MQLTSARFTGKVVRIDQEKRHVYVAAQLPDDGRLELQIVTFGNPEYVNNSAYTVHRLYRAGSSTILDLGPQRLDLGRAVVAEVDHEQRIIKSSVPHDYARGLARLGTEFFTGKRLTVVDGEASTTIVKTEHNAPFLIHVQSTRGFRKGQELRYLDLQVGDTFSINNWGWAMEQNGRWQARGTVDVSFQAEQR